MKSPARMAAAMASRDITVSPDGKSAYVANIVVGVFQYDIDQATGVLTAKNPPTVAAGNSPSSVVVSPNGKSVYVTNKGDLFGGDNTTRNTVSQYNVDTTTGTLSPKSPATVATGSAPSAVAVSPDGKSAYVTNSGDDSVSRFNIDSATETGGLTAAGPALDAGNEPSAVAVSPDGKSVYVTNYQDDNVSQYSVDSAGVLTAKRPPTIATGQSPKDIVIAPDIDDGDPGPLGRPEPCAKTLYENRLEVPREVRLIDLVKGKGITVRASAGVESSGSLKAEITGRKARYFKVFGKRYRSKNKMLASKKVKLGKDPKDVYLVARGKTRRLIKRAIHLRKAPKMTKLKVSLTTQPLANNRLKRLNTQTVRALRHGKVHRTGTYVKVRKVLDRSECGEPLAAKIKGAKQVGLTALTTRSGNKGKGIKVRVSCSEDCTATVGLRMWGRYEIGLKFRKPGEKINRFFSSRKVSLNAGETRTLWIEGVTSKRLRKLLVRSVRNERYKRIKLKYSIEARTKDGQSTTSAGTSKVRLRFK